MSHAPLKLSRGWRLFTVLAILVAVGLTLLAWHDDVLWVTAGRCYEMGFHLESFRLDVSLANGQRWKWGHRDELSISPLFLTQGNRGYNHLGLWVERYTLPAPLAFVWPLALAGPIVAAMRFYRRRHSEPVRLCPRCEYDLRGSTDKCPECGRPIDEEPITSELA